MKNFRYFLSLLPGMLAIVGNLLGGYYVWMNIIYVMFGLVVLDWLTKENKETPQGKEGDFVPDFILVLSFLVHSISVFTLLYGVYSGIISGGFIAVAVLSTAINSGISGIISAHEMIHRKQAIWRIIGIWNLVWVNYGHFFIEHIKGHHKWVGTIKDPATALRGESIYAFVWRTIPGQFKSAYKIECERLQKEGKNKRGWGNFVVRITVLQLLLCASIGLLFGLKILMVYLFQSLIAVLLLEYVNYIEHYGLVRNENEKYKATHAWQSDIVISRFSLFELSRHSDHHLKASKPYQTLATHASSPVLPSGYFGVFYIVLIPSLWYKRVHPLLDEMH
ncbi:MAG: alkane 1-monooxygenase [Bacteroidetes bacterium]|nr:alkane 1-monooxygenase [Bacteroidota bacterium]